IVETSVAFTGYFSQNSGLNFAGYYPTLSLDNLTNGRAQNAITILQELQPDFLNLGSEPDTQASLANQPAINTPPGYATYVSTMMSQINAAGAHIVRIGAGIGTWLGQELGTSFVNGLLTTGIDYLDLHIYPVNKDFFSDAITLSDIFIQAGKPVAISE